MNFGTWHELADAARVAPEQSGVLQARGRSLLAFPGGKSAMVLYACSESEQTLRHYVTTTGAPRLAQAAATGAGLVRFGVTPNPEAELRRLLDRFSARFGALPPGNRADAAPVSPAAAPSTPAPSLFNKDDSQGGRQDGR